MAVTIDVPPQVEANLRRAAAEAGESLAGYLQQIAEREANAKPVAVPSLAQMLAGRIGIIDSAANTDGKPSRLSEDKSAFSSYLERRHREGSL
ncbi:MAG: hypothetical protein NT029_09480 [Armatimonadetes bacterium]|nr:hypothetical protein [Armatimonadota bacterium]